MIGMSSPDSLWECLRCGHAITIHDVREIWDDMLARRGGEPVPRNLNTKLQLAEATVKLVALKKNRIALRDARWRIVNDAGRGCEGEGSHDGRCYDANVQGGEIFSQSGERTELQDLCGHCRGVYHATARIHMNANQIRGTWNTIRALARKIEESKAP